VASRLGFDVEEIEDLRAADELASLVVESADGGDLSVQFAVQDNALRIEGDAALAAGRADNARVDDLTAQILAAVVDEWDLSTTEGSVRFSCVRRVPPAPA
jgi:hypothetical protein